MKSEFLYLHHIRERCERIAGCVRVGRGTFLSEAVYQDAVLRNLEVIGEAAERVSAEMRAQLPGVDWRRIDGLRDVIIHDSPSVELETVWTIASRDVPTLLETLNHFLRERGQLP